MHYSLFSSLLAAFVFGSIVPGSISGGDDSGTSAPVSASPVVVAGTGLTASYFSNGTLAGSPVLKRVDPLIDFNWGLGAPSGDLPTDYFSVRWEGLLAAPTTGTYRFQVPTNDEIRLWVNGKKVLDTWDGRREDNSNAFVELAAREKTVIKLEYVDADGEAHLQLQWIPPGQGPQIIPTANLYPVGSSPLPDPDVASTTPAPAAKPTPAPVAAKPTPAPAKPAPAPVAAKPAPTPAKPTPAAAPAAKTAAPVAKAPAKPAATPAPAVAAKPAAPAAPTVIEPAVYIIRSRTTGRPLEIYDPSRPNTQAVQAATGSTAPAQATNMAAQWRIEPQNDGFYRLIVPGNNRVLEVLGSSTSNGAPLDLWPYFSGNNQVWHIEPTTDGYYKLTAKHSKKAITARDSTDAGIVQWRSRNNQNQDWKLEKVVPKNKELARIAIDRPGIGANKMSIYPNPSNGVAQLTYRLSEETPVGWVLYNNNGAVVRVSDYRKRPIGIQLQTLEFVDLPAGDYFLHLTVGNVTTRHPLMLRKPSAVTPDATPTEQ